MQSSITVNDSEVLKLLSGLEGLDWSIPLKRFSGHFRRQIGRQIESAGDAERGGSGRGVFWRPMRPHYVRGDGTVVPAWGGVPKIRGEGTVQGRKKAAGKRQAAGAKLYGGAFSSPGRLLKRRVQGDTLTIELSKMPGLQYAEGLRPFHFFQDPQDRQKLERTALAFAKGEIRSRGGER